MKINKIKYYNLKNLRKIHYNRSIVNGIKNFNLNMNDWVSHPYTFLKSRFYIEVSCLLVYLAQFTNITPNFLTMIYALLGAIGGVLIACNNSFLIIIGLIVLFTKNIFDWSDGLLAKVKGQSSNLGELLDNWGAIVGSYCFVAGFGFYLFHRSDERLFLIIAFLIILLKSLDLKNFAYQLSMYELFRSKNKNEILKKLNLKKKQTYSLYKNIFIIKIKNFLQNFLDDRSRSVDFILLLILIDNFYLNIVLIEYVYYYILLRSVLLFLGGMYITLKKKHLYKN